MSIKNKYFTNSPGETKKIGQLLAEKILKSKPKKGAQVLALKGDLGGGKTTFLKGFAKGLKVGKKILSPTFLIFKKFKIRNKDFKNFYHFDCYRIQKPKEILELDFKKIISEPQNIVAVEWAERIKKILPQNIIWIFFGFLNKKKRKVLIKFSK